MGFNDPYAKQYGETDQAYRNRMVSLAAAPVVITRILTGVVDPVSTDKFRPGEDVLVERTVLVPAKTTIRTYIDSEGYIGSYRTEVVFPDGTKEDVEISKIKKKL